MARTPLLRVLLSLVIGLPLSTDALAQAVCPARASWPTAVWTDRSAEVATQRADAIKKLEDYAFTLEGEDAERKGIRTDGVLIVHDDAIVYERYARSFDASTPHLSWSMAKSVTSTLTGVAVAQGALNLDDSICRYLEGVPEDACAVTQRHCLEFATGFDWAENYENQTYQSSSVLAMLYGQGRGDMARFVFEHPLRDPPGTSYDYSTGDAVLAAAVLNKALIPWHGENWAWTLLFDRIGMSQVTFERDPQGTLAGGSFMVATARDYARLGYLFLNDGCWADQRILPEGWVHDSTRVNEPYKTKHIDSGNTWVAGRSWWLNKPVPEQGLERPWPDVPDDAYAASGHWGQEIVIIPSLDLIVVRLADDRDDAYDFNDFVKLAMEVGR